MSGGAPLAWIYEPAPDGEHGVMRPVRRDMKKADERFCYGETYVLDVVEMAQSKRDRGYHVRMKELWAQLPEKYDGEFPTDEDFRKYCLIECGFSTKIRSPFPSEKDALAALPLIAAFKKEFCLVEVEGSQVVVTMALSQKLSEARGGMSIERRHESYKATEDFARDIVGVTQQQVDEYAGRSA